MNKGMAMLAGMAALAAGSGVAHAPYVRGSGSTAKRRDMDNTEVDARMQGWGTAKRGGPVEHYTHFRGTAAQTAFIQGHRAGSEPRLYASKPRRARVR